ncbi:RNA polymerase sigma-70 factor (family 1) [Pedobacter africanus]|uniref:RNA polymerase sigma-70 factor (ECF subfamily) n=1 Tax=Pedobacter africanus TaxID=151894 RepID=A0ACC6KW25_9SPHI|nr:RNA polymerase sigma-70 factor [Pedobacter africanus]MDR6783288.1 RNA polymerase sigma-70 factor (ECF subfamily) [Pedobacter africanus]
MDSLEKLSDLELTLLLKEGNQSAFTEIYERYWAGLFRHAQKMLRNEEEAADIVQDIFAMILNKADSLNFTGSISGFLYASVRNKTLDFIRGSKVRDKFITTMMSLSEKNHYHLNEDLIAQDLAMRIEEGIAKLPPKMRRVFELSRKSGLSQSEIADKLDISETTVKKQIGRAIKILRMRIQLIIITTLLLIF